MVTVVVVRKLASLYSDTGDGRNASPPTQSAGEGRGRAEEQVLKMLKVTIPNATQKLCKILNGVIILNQFYLWKLVCTVNAINKYSADA